MTKTNESTQPAQPLGVASTEGLGQVPERADWHAHGMDWAFVEATDPAASDDWTTDDVARAFAAGAALAERLNAAEIERLRADRDSWAQQASDRAADAVALVAAERTNNELLSEMLAQEKLLRLQEVAAERERWAEAFVSARDAVLHDRGPLEGEGLDSDKTNAVLAVLDEAFAGLC